MGKKKVTIPTNVEELLELARQIAAKHATDGAGSILNSVQDYSWNTLAPTIQACLDQHRQAEQLRRQSEQAYQERNLLLTPIAEAVRSSRDLLMGAFRNTPRKLGDWGFDVSEPSSSTPPPSA